MPKSPWAMTKIVAMISPVFLLWFGCKTPDELGPGAALSSSESGTDGFASATSFLVEGDEVLAYRCQNPKGQQSGSRSLEGCTPIARRDLTDFRKDLERLYLREKGAKTLTAAEKALIDAGLALLRRERTGKVDLGTVQPGEVHEAMTRYRQIIEEAMGLDPNRESGAVSEGKGSGKAEGFAEGFALAETMQLVNQSLVVPFGAFTSSPLYTLTQPVQATGVTVTLSPSNNLACGAAVTSVNVATTDQPTLGALKAMGGGRFESHSTGRVLRITALQVSMAQTTYNVGYCHLLVTSRFEDSPPAPVNGLPRDAIAEYYPMEADCSVNMGCPQYFSDSEYGCYAEEFTESGPVRRFAVPERGNNSCAALGVRTRICQSGQPPWRFTVLCHQKEAPEPVPAGAVRVAANTSGMGCNQMMGCTQQGIMGDKGCEAIGPQGIRFTDFSGFNNGCDLMSVYRKVCTANADRVQQFQFHCYRDPN